MIEVDIYGQTYKVRGEEDRAYIEELSRYVDSKMKSISASTGTGDSLKIAILAALNIADEYFKLEREHQEAQRHVAATASELAGALDALIEEENKGAAEPERGSGT